MSEAIRVCSTGFDPDEWRVTLKDNRESVTKVRVAHYPKRYYTAAAAEQDLARQYVDEIN